MNEMVRSNIKPKSELFETENINLTTTKCVLNVY